MNKYTVEKDVGDDEIKMSLWASAHGVSPKIFEIDSSKIVWQYLDPIDPEDIDKEKLFNLLLKAVQIGLSHRDAGPVKINNGANMNVRQDQNGRYYLIDWGEANYFPNDDRKSEIEESLKLESAPVSPSATPTRKQMDEMKVIINYGHNWNLIFKKEAPNIFKKLGFLEEPKSKSNLIEKAKREMRNQQNAANEARILKRKLSEEQKTERSNMGAEDSRSVQVKFGKPSRFYFGGFRVSVDTAFGLYKRNRKFTLMK